MKIAVIIPSFNSAHTLARVLKSFPKGVYEKNNAVVIVNDCSTDSTIELVKKLKKTYPNINLINHPQNRGYGGALKSGLEFAYANAYDIMPVVHSDGQYAPEKVLELCQPIKEGLAEIVQGSRMKGGARQGKYPMPMNRYLPNKILTMIENFTFNTSMAEFHSGYMVYSRKLLSLIPYQKLQNNYNFDAEMIIMAKLVGKDCAEIPIPTRYDEETSSLNPIPYGLNVLKMIVKYDLGFYKRLLDEFHVGDFIPSKQFC